MKWRKKEKKHNQEKMMMMKKKPSSSFTFSLSSWFSKLKPSPKPCEPTPAPRPTPISSPTRCMRRNHSLESKLNRRGHPELMRPIKTCPRRDADMVQTGRRSFSGGRIRPRVRVQSPRLVNPKPPNLGAKEKGLERFAVVKASSNLAKDFRESMVEMIWEGGIGRPDELESLLACYLSLNSDEHHDVIVKVFRQLWFDLDRELSLCSC